MMAVFDFAQGPLARADAVDPVALVQRHCIFAVFSQGPAFGCLDPGYRLALAENSGADASRGIVEAGLVSSLLKSGRRHVTDAIPTVQAPSSEWNMRLFQALPEIGASFLVASATAFRSLISASSIPSRSKQSFG